MKNHAPHHKDIADILGSVRDRDHYTVIRDFFELSAISIRNNFDHGNEYANLEKRYTEIAQGYKKEYLEGFATALGMLGKKIQDAVNCNAPFADWAGELYMDSGTSNGKAGQFFTPYSVSQCMARINFPKDEVKAKLGDDPNHVLTIYEPTCGAGGLIVASIDALNEAGVNYSWNAFVDCGDIDPRCVHMTYVTLSLLGVPAVVRLGDALAMEYRQNWFTPAYLMAWPHFKRQIGRGNYPNSATVPKSSEPPENAPEPPKQETREPVPAIAETVPTMDANGQYSLF
jgi:hypothetical protein